MPKKFEKICLHVGLGKTGSTAIQQMLLAEAEWLESAAGFFVPQNFSDPRPFGGNHSVFLRSLFAQRPEELRFNIAAGLDTRDKIARSDQALREAYVSNFESTSAPRMVLSAEGVGHYDIGTLENLADWLTLICEEIEVIACVRHPLHALAAEIQQRLKSGARLNRLYERPPFYRYSEIFGRLESCFGKESLTLYDYSEACAPNGTAVSAFLSRLGLQLAHESNAHDRVNVGISHEATLLLDALNKQRPLVVEGRLNENRRPGDLQTFLSIAGERYQPPEHVYALLERSSKVELDWLEANYGLRLDPMDSVVGQDAPGTAFSDHFLDKMAILLSDLINSRNEM